jgi:hypothetical protein
VGWCPCHWSQCRILLTFLTTPAAPEKIPQCHITWDQMWHFNLVYIYYTVYRYAIFIFFFSFLFFFALSHSTRFVVKFYLVFFLFIVYCKYF